MTFKIVEATTSYSVVSPKRAGRVDIPAAAPIVAQPARDAAEMPEIRIEDVLASQDVSSADPVDELEIEEVSLDAISLDDDPMDDVEIDEVAGSADRIAPVNVQVASSAELPAYVAPVKVLPSFPDTLVDAPGPARTVPIARISSDVGSAPVAPTAPVPAPAKEDPIDELRFEEAIDQIAAGLAAVPNIDMPSSARAPSADGLEVVRKVLLGEAHAESERRFDILSEHITELSLTVKKSLERLESRIHAVEAKVDARLAAVAETVADVSERHDALDSLVSTAVSAEIENIKASMIDVESIPHMLRTMANAMNDLPLRPSWTADDRVHALVTGDLRIK